jgi:hypothetical protein
MRKLIITGIILAFVATGVAACNLTGGGACSGSQCAQEDEGEWEIDIDGHKRKKQPVAVPVKPIAPVKPAVPVKPVAPAPRVGKK